MRQLWVLLVLLLAGPVGAHGVHYDYAGGHYVGGAGSSHKGGHYVNPWTANHYRRHKG
jgi:hypothetical protein